MKKMKKILSLLLVFALTFGCMSGMAHAMTWGEKPADGVTEGQPFASGTGGSNLFRIPCLVSLDDGTIVAGCDARWNTSLDGGGLDTIVSYSKDKGETWNYTFANYLGDNGKVANYASTAFIDPAMATDGKTVWMIADLYPAGIALNGAHYGPVTGHRGYDVDGNLALTDDKSADANGDGIIEVDVNGDGSRNAWDYVANAEYNYSLVKKANATNEDYYEIKKDGVAVEGYTVDAWFNITGEDVDTNLFCSDSPYRPYPTDFLYMTSSTDGGATWSIPTLLDLKDADEQSLLVGPGRGTVTESGRIVFTAYEFTNGDRFSCTLYSDDKGLTWERGADVSMQSSEAVVTEADGRLYMFTRYGNAYYISEDEGKTWGPQLKVDAEYYWRCQYSAITYSEKIDGKTAILFSAPSDKGNRANGSIFVGLVQEDGTLEWPYEYKVNDNGAPYAYSCLTEVETGLVGLLYESNGAEITYKNIAIEDIAVGAAIGDIWFNDAEGPVASLNVKPGANVTLTLDGALEDAAIDVVSANEEAVAVTVEGNTVNVAVSEEIVGFEQVAITAKAGDAETTLTVNVAEADNYEIVNMAMGDTVTIADETGNYEASVDLTTVDTTVAEVTVIGDDGTNPDEAEIEAATLQLGTTTDFADSSVAASVALFTVASTFNMSATDKDGNTVYLEPYATTNGNGYPNVTSAVALTVEPTGTENLFYINGNGGYLHFHDGRYDRVMNKSGYEAGCSFMFYEAVAAGETASTEIPGFKAVSEVKPGGQYLIVAVNGGAYYVMYPTTAKTNGLYTQVAKVTGESVDGVATVQLGNSTAFAGEKISAADCLYTFTAVETTVSGNANGTTVYLNLGTASKPTTTTAENIRITESAYTDGAFEFYGETNSRYLHFHDDSVKFNRCGSNDENHSFEVYKVAETPSVSDAITGYTKVTELSEILAGGQFLITRQADDDNYYVLYPTTNTGSVYNYVGKVQNFELPGPSTEITINAVSEGQTSVEVNGLTYYIIVKNEEKDITLEIGESIKFAGAVQKMDEAQTVVSLTDVEAIAPYTRVDEVTEGKFLIGNSSHVIVNAPTKVENANPTGLDMTYAVFEKAELEAYLWKFTAVNGGYTIQDVNGQYITFNGNAVVLSDTAQTFVLAEDARDSANNLLDGFSISSGGMYLNNFSRANNRVAGWTGNDCAWLLYAPSTGVEITAAEAGTTTITIGGVNYNITVNSNEEPPVEPKDEVCTVFDDVTHAAWYEVAVQYVYENGIMKGTDTTTFAPNGNVTRAQVIETLYNMTGRTEDYDAVNPAEMIKDYDESKWWAEALKWALSVGVATGDAETKLFNATNNVSRQELAAFLYRYETLCLGNDGTVDEASKELIKDAGVSTWAQIPFAWSVSKGIITGAEQSDGSYQYVPKTGANRAQLATMLMRYCGE